MHRLQRVRNFPVLLGRGGLHPELLGARTELIENVARAAHVAIRLGQAVDRLLTLVTQTPDASRFLDQLAAKRRRGLNDEVDVVLRRHGIAVLP